MYCFKRILKRMSWALVACPVLMCCSCQSSNVMPQDPFMPSPDISIVRPETVRENRIEKDPNFLFWQPTYKPTYESGGPSGDGKTRTVKSKSKGIAILPVAFADNGEEEPKGRSGSGAASKKPKLNDLAIDPSLSERGSKIVAEQREGRETFQGAWRPPKRAGFWPQIEYLADGGDDGASVYVEEDWSVHNLGEEDTVAHFDTLDGRTIVEPSNRIHLYAPRFGAVRKVEGVFNSGQIMALSGANNQLALHIDKSREQLGYTAQESQTGYARTRSQLGGVGSRRAGAGAGGSQGLGAYGGFEAVMLYSNWLRQRSIGSAELAYLAEGSAGARAWQGNEAIKVQVNTLAPMIASSEEGAESFFQIEEDESKTSKLRLIKVASKKTAQPGEIVDFTLRFDNIGNQPIGNVTIIDSLTTRLEFLAGTAKSSVESGFVVEPNDGGSFTLRFEITDPLLPGQFGVVQFQCRVR